MKKQNEQAWLNAVESAEKALRSGDALSGQGLAGEAARLMRGLGVETVSAPDSVLLSAINIFQPVRKEALWAKLVRGSLGLAGARLQGSTERQWVFELGDFNVRVAASFDSGEWSVMGRTNLTSGHVLMGEHEAPISQDGAFEIAGSDAFPDVAIFLSGPTEIFVDLDQGDREL